jgi:predicted N-acetyltransferase YhbS
VREQPVGPERATLAEADRRQVLEIYRQSHSLWGIGLSPNDYVALWDDISRTPWARRNAEFLVWRGPRGAVLSSLKLYRPRMRVSGRVVRAAVLGAVFTPPDQRGRGYAADLVRAVLDRARNRGDELALLFSDIGSAYYQALGFVALPAEEHWGALPRRPADLPAGWGLRPATEGDRDWIRRAHAESSERRAIAVLRDAAHWDYLELRTRAYFSRLRGGELRSTCTVLTEEGRFAGFVTAVEGRSEWTVREVAVPGGEPVQLARALRIVGAAARRAGHRRFYGWLPPELVDHLGDWKVRRGPRRRAIPMIRALAPTIELTALGALKAAYLPYLDQF